MRGEAVTTRGIVFLLGCVNAAGLAGCRRDEVPSSAPAATPAAPTPGAACRPAPECVPPRPPATGDLACTVAGVAVTCPQCTADGALAQCVDVDGDGCVDFALTPCGRPNGCETKPTGEAGCRALGPMAPAVIFGFVDPPQQLPAGFVGLRDGQVVEVRDNTLEVAVKTRGQYVGPTRWSVGVSGAGLALPARLAPAEYLPVDDDYGVLRQALDVRGFDPRAQDVELTFTLEDYRGSLTTRFQRLRLSAVAD